MTADSDETTMSKRTSLPSITAGQPKTCHTHLPPAILSAFIDAWRGTAPSRKTSVLTVPRGPDSFYESVE